MNKVSILIFLFISSTAMAATKEEFALQQQCAKKELSACENLTAYYAKTSQWDNTIALGQALCTKDIMNGCTLAGTALLAQKKTKEGILLLTKSCDGFEPLACRSLSRLMKQTGDEITSYMYSKRACHYGLNESCKNLKKPKETYSPKGLAFLKDVASDCEDSNSSTCQARLGTLKECGQIFSEKDCLLIPGELSIYFRAKLIQESAKLTLMNLVALEKSLKMTSKQKRYSYDLKLVLKDRMPLSMNHYVFGFMKACTTKYEKAKGAVSTSLALYKKSYSQLSSRSINNIAAFFYKGKQDECYDPRYGHEAFALANLDPLNTARLDIWKTNGDGDIIQVQDGLPLP